MAKKKRFRISRKTKNAIFITIALLIVGYAIYAMVKKPTYAIEPTVYTEKHNAVYRYIHDGDTAVFLLDDGTEVICRFLAVDTPELGEEGYDEAKRYTDNTLEKASNIVLELDPQSERYDKYERLLAWVWVDGELMQAKLIENGYAQVKYIFHEYLYLDYLDSLAKNVTN